MHTPIRGKPLAALRAVAGAPTGLRLEAYPSAMPLLVGMGLVEERAASRVRRQGARAWFLTPEGRAVVRAYGTDDA